MANQNHGELGQLNPRDRAQFAVHVNREQQRRNRTDEFEWDETNGRSDQTSENIDPPSKRRRVALACSVCRARKSRVGIVTPERKPSPPLCIVSDLACSVMARDRSVPYALSLGLSVAINSLPHPQMLLLERSRFRLECGILFIV
jgi:hypothetical protein